ncbi:MAG TPA: carboxypeptidase regulatory-like domain-containing protein [Rectinemataceae bacterium]|nr:carboxypeptidase regulatory-like domain-containing protein [Rectinemataceae bacterium]
MRAAPLRALILAAATILSCASAGRVPGADRSGPPLFGMVYDDDNVPVAGARVSVDGGDPVTSDVNGRFALPAPSIGSHSLVVEKPLFETARDGFDYQSAVQLLYVKLFSARQLAARAEGALVRRDLALAAEILERVLALAPDDIEARYAAAIVAYRSGRAAEARSLLEALVREGCREPAIYLFLADIAQFNEKKNEAAAGYLKRSLDLRGDPDVERRLAELERSGLALR